ncbi:hypothetical protein BJF93_20630 [Xaviernesmea oryzae]|uniref:Uncharacterized protein n=1 Tax=Xaviernesmea oryzae TaxID=464029 RepID=A0A1Q9AZQ0_9HYPH|nr:hypothetical protein [Xaviernesmea oryzae]OLP61202.1 hypothetical protein BJF93_20630 [Xaviernesmea oryzae]SEL50136.1 hypothetical protein SAMN04487976_1092 [Xaviernesmea oryzae]
MIAESAPWKDHLLKDADLIERWAEKAHPSERGSILLERKVFVSAFAMRKLIECEKVSSDIAGRSVRAEKFDLLPGRTLTWWKRHSFWDAFDMNAPTTCSLGVGDLLDIIVHSKVFSECVYGEHDLRVSGFFVTSDRKDSHLWLVPLKAFTGLMRLIGNDYPSVGRIVFDSEGKHYSWQGHGEPPAQIAEKMANIVSNRIKSDR